MLAANRYYRLIPFFQIRKINRTKFSIYLSLSKVRRVRNSITEGGEVAEGMKYKSYSRWFAVLLQMHHVPAQRLDLLRPFHHVHPRFLPWRGHPPHGVHAHPSVRGSHALDRIDRHPPG